MFFLLSFYFLERRKWWQSGILLGLAVVSKPSIFIFLIPAYVLVVLLLHDVWKQRITNLCKIGSGSLLALLPWLAIYAGEIKGGGLMEDILAHFKNPYAEAGLTTVANISANIPTLVTSTTVLYLWAMLATVIFALFLEQRFRWEYKNLLIIFSIYAPFALLQYLKSFGYLRYLIAAELLTFILFLGALPCLFRWFLAKTRFSLGASTLSGLIVALLVVVQTIHLFGFSDLYASEKTQKTIVHLYSTYPLGTIGIINVPQVASFVPSFQKYQYLSTYGLSDFGTHMLYLAPERLPNVLVTESVQSVLSAEEQEFLDLRYERDDAFTEGFTVYRKR